MKALTVIAIFMAAIIAGCSRSKSTQHDVTVAKEKDKQQTEEISYMSKPSPSVVSGNTNGSISPAPKGGTQGYTYTWTDGKKSESATDMAPGTYSVIVTDANGAMRDREYNTEDYASVVENDFKNAKESPLSTFSIDVDKASYSNTRRYLMSGALPPTSAVRVEEMVNYFDYDYPAPKGEHPFSITSEVSDCPWNPRNRLVHIGLKGRELDMDNRPKSNLVFLLDVSGSMNEANKLPLVKSSLSLLINNLTEDDRVAIVVYAGAAGQVLESTPATKKEKILGALDNLSAGGSTAGGEGIELAYKIAKENFIKGGSNRIILATDGDFNVGPSSDGELVKLIENKRKEGVYLSVLGFGTGNYKDNKMEQLADKGNGNYAYIDNLFEAQKVLVSEAGGTLYAIAKDVKIQVEFNPELVQSYRLIGYENRVMANEDFNDDTKDAGEIGAGHTVTALYEITPVGSGSGKVDPLKYQSNVVNETAKTSKEILTVKFRYKVPNGNEVSKLITVALQDNHIALDKTSDNFRFSAAVAEFGMILSESKHKGSSSYKSLLALANGAKGIDKDGYRMEFINLVKLASNIEPYKAEK